MNDQGQYMCGAQQVEGGNVEIRYIDVMVGEYRTCMCVVLICC